jgi:hypothetical protein
MTGRFLNYLLLQDPAQHLGDLGDLGLVPGAALLASCRYMKVLVGTCSIDRQRTPSRM